MKGNEKTKQRYKAHQTERDAGGRGVNWKDEMGWQRGRELEVRSEDGRERAPVKR